MTNLEAIEALVRLAKRYNTLQRGCNHYVFPHGEKLVEAERLVSCVENFVRKTKAIIGPLASKDVNRV